MAHVESLDHYWWVEVFVVCFALKNSVAYIAITIVVMDFFFSLIMYHVSQINLFFLLMIL